MKTEEINALIEQWTQEERGAIHDALATLRIGPVQLGYAENTWAMPIVATIGAKRTETIQARAHLAMKPAKLVILEPKFEQIGFERISTAARVEKTWWGRTREIEPATVRSIEHKSVVSVPRAIWRIRSIFIGNRAAFPTEKDISGDLFGPEGLFSLGPMIMPGLDVTLVVENKTSQELPFHAVVVGTPAVERETAPSAATAAS